MSSLSVRLQPATEPTALAFPAKAVALARQLAAVPRLAQVTAAARLEVRPAPEMVSSGVCEMNALTGGLPRGCLTEIAGPASSGRTSVMLAALAAATRRQEACALVDITDAFDPRSGAAAGMDFGRLLWVRCGASHEHFSTRRHRDTEKREGKICDPHRGRPVERALRVTDLLLQSGGFGMVAIDLGDVPEKTARRVPLTSWFRFRRLVEGTPTALLVMSRIPCAQSCAALLVKLQPSAFSCQPSGTTQPSHARIFEGLRVEGELLRSRVERKPAASVRMEFTARAKWG
jgi:recA bacterial DNA recombination protein